MMHKLLKYIGLITILWAGTVLAAPVIEIEALMTNTAVLKIDGQRKTLKVGQSFGGVTLIAAYSRTATLEVDGQQMVMGISRHIGANYQEPKERLVTIKRNNQLQYHTTASINGRNMPVLVDTGANLVAMSEVHAKSLNIPFETGARGKVETASGLVDAWVITLRSVSVGGIKVERVQATVVQGSFPNTILLGMSYLQHVEMKENGGVLSLSRAW